MDFRHIQMIFCKIPPTCARCSCQPQAVEDPCSNRPEAHMPCKPGCVTWNMKYLKNHFSKCFFQKHPHLLTGNVTTLNTGSLLRTSCLCLVAHRQLRGREICMSFTQMSKSKFTKYALNYLFPRMDYVNDGCRSDFLNVFDVSSGVTPESHQQSDQSSQRWIQGFSLPRPI